MTEPVRTIFGMPAYGRSDTLARTLESLLAQTQPDFAVVIVDDRTTPEVRAVVERYASRDPRVVYEPNSERLGMVGNWRRAFERGRELFPGADYFAWVSDHDIWHPRWLEVLSKVLDESPETVLAYSRAMRLYRQYRRRAGIGVDTSGVSRRENRLRIANTLITAGNAIYGLFRVSVLERAGVFRPVLLPDRQILTHLSLYGQFEQVDEILWYREVAGAFSYDRQRRMFFTARPPWFTYLPVNVQHAGVLLWDLAVRGRGRPQIGRWAGLRLSALQWWIATVRDIGRALGETREQCRRTAIGRWLAPPAAVVSDEAGSAGRP